jgi:DNA-binding response OmpR family regulator
MPSDERDYRYAPAVDAVDKHALIIEDLPVIAISIQDELSDLGFSAAIASTETEAVALAEERCPDLIIADVRLEKGSGIDAVRRICRDRPIAVIFMTGDLDLVESPIGEADLLSKPFTTTALRSSIGTAGPIFTG